MTAQADVKTGWLPIETAPKDGTWFIALPRPELGFGGEPFPPTVARFRGPYPNIEGPDHPPTWSIDCKAMNSGSSIFKPSDFTHWAPLPEMPA